MRFNSAIAAAILAVCATHVLAAPMPQLAGEGSAADSIFTDTDNGVGYGVEDAEDNIAGTISQLKGTQTPGTPAAPGVPAAPPAPPARRQLDKVANGAGAIGNAAGASVATNPVVGAADSADGTLTGGAANAGATVGGTEESTLEGVGSAVPKQRRQGDKISNGLGAIGNAAGVGVVTGPVASTGDSVDGTLTGGAANAGAEVGSTEESTLEGAGSAVPKRWIA